MYIENYQNRFSERITNVPTSFIREILKVASRPEVVSFAGGLPNPDCFPVQQLKECTSKVFDKFGLQVLQYAESGGYSALREFIAAKYRDQNIAVSPENVLITNGSQQALDLIAKLFINPNDVIALERPSYLGALQSFSVFQPLIREVDLQHDGIDTEQLEECLKDGTVKLFYAIPNFQNPTGISYSAEKRRKTAQIISDYGTILVEDDPYGEISFLGERRPPICSYIPEQSILLGSFSKTIAPGLRLGWMIANSEIIRKATVLKQASDLHSGNLSQYILAEFLSTYNYQAHLDKINAFYKKQHDVMLDCLSEYFPETVSFTRPEGGMFTWLKLPEDVTARTLLQRAIENNILFVPGECFYSSLPNPHTLRLNFSNVAEERMRFAMQKLASLLSV